jgi:hypothetical protein
MFVITTDQIDSQHSDDAVASAVADIERRWGDRLRRRPERTAGDEFQLLAPDGDTAMRIMLHLSRSANWSIGTGIGSVRTPIPESIRAGAGDAFVGARSAVERAKKKSSHCAIDAPGHGARAGHLESLVDLLLATRSRRSAEGWELFDLLETGMTQGAAASALGISPQAVSLRAQAADLKLETAVTVAIGSLLDEFTDAIDGSETA